MDDITVEPMSKKKWTELFTSSLIRIMDEQKLTQLELANRIGMSQCAISLYVSGKRTPDIRAAVNIAYAVGVPVEELIDFGSPIE